MVGTCVVRDRSIVSDTVDMIGTVVVKRGKPYPQHRALSDE